MKMGETHKDFFGESAVWEFLANHLKVGEQAVDHNECSGGTR